MTVVKVPSEVRIGGVVYTIRLRRQLNADHGAQGRCVYNPARIDIDAGLIPSQKANTLIHEFMHVLQNSLGWHDLPKDEQPKEADVGAMASAWAELFAKLGIEFDFADVPVQDL